VTVKITAGQSPSARRRGTDVRVATVPDVGADAVALGLGVVLVAVAVAQFLAGVYGGASVAGVGAMLSFSFAVLLG
jgi:hypothetical protein